jgi:hypothetical protein
MNKIINNYNPKVKLIEILEHRGEVKNQVDTDTLF